MTSNRIGHFAKHLMHRRCETCWSAGFAAGFLKAAVESERRERLREAGYSKAQIERWSEDSIRAVQS